MKKFKLILFFGYIFLFVNIGVRATQKEVVSFSKCVDGDTIKVLLDGKEKIVRMLAIDTPESVHPTKGVEYYGKEASNFTCDIVKSANKLELEYDDNSDKEDKYGRLLVWVFVDGELLQDKLIQSGYAEVAYLYGDYKYTSLLQDHQAVVETKKIGIWDIEAREEYNAKNDIEEDISNIDDDYADYEIEGTIEDAVSKIKKLDIDYNNITKEDIKDILFIVVASLIIALWKPIKKKIKKFFK